jgi:hypothetical protein
VLYASGAAHRVDYARKFYEHAVAGRLRDPTVLLADLWADEPAAMSLEVLARPFLIGPHQPRTAGDISRQDCRQPALDTLSLPARHELNLARREHAVLNNLASGGRRRYESVLAKLLLAAESVFGEAGIFGLAAIEM